MVNRMIDFIEPAFLDWGLLIVFVATFLESSLFVASIVPGEATLMLGGFFSSPRARPGGAPPLALPEVVAVAFAGALAGGVAGYLIGRAVGRPLVRRYGRWFFLPERRLPVLERYIHHYGARAVVLGRFAPFLRSIRSMVAGIARMPFPRFLAAEALGAALWAAGIVAVGFAAGESWRVTNRYLGAGGAVVFVILAVAWWLTWRSVRGRFERELAEAPAEGLVSAEEVPQSPPADPPPSLP